MGYHFNFAYLAQVCLIEFSFLEIQNDWRKGAMPVPEFTTCFKPYIFVYGVIFADMIGHDGVHVFILRFLPFISGEIKPQGKFKNIILVKSPKSSIVSVTEYLSVISSWAFTGEKDKTVSKTTKQ